MIPKDQATSTQVFEVKDTDLPLCCPMPGSTLWNMHPRVFLPIETTGKEQCPYCGALYVLTSHEAAAKTASKAKSKTKPKSKPKSKTKS